jgi:cytochrome c oxidase subunit III
MSVVIVFMLVVIGFSAWWLVRGGLLTKPWLEVGPNPAGGPGPAGMPTEKIALGLFLAVVAALFALFASAYLMRTEFVDWRPMPVPRIVWLNTAMLVLASIALQCALVAVRQDDVDTTRLSLVTATVATLGFLAGQIVAWRDLAASGYLLTGSPANSFFYLLTGLHGLHVVGGLVALARTAPGAWGVGRPGSLRLRIELCTTYWHFLLLVWIALLALFTGRAGALVDICRQLLT